MTQEQQLYKLARSAKNLNRFEEIYFLKACRVHKELSKKDDLELKDVRECLKYFDEHGYPFREGIIHTAQNTDEKTMKWFREDATEYVLSEAIRLASKFTGEDLAAKADEVAKKAAQEKEDALKAAETKAAQEKEDALKAAEEKAAQEKENAVKAAETKEAEKCEDRLVVVESQAKKVLGKIWDISESEYPTDNNLCNRSMKPGCIPVNKELQKFLVQREDSGLVCVVEHKNDQGALESVLGYKVGSSHVSVVGELNEEYDAFESQGDCFISL